MTLLRHDNDALADNPDRFAYLRSPVATIWYLVGAGVAAIVLALSLIFFDDISAMMMADESTGRRDWFKPFVAPTLVVLSAVVAGNLIYHAARSSGRWCLVDGTPLSTKAWRVAGSFDELHARLSSGDPSQFLPIKRGDAFEKRLRAYTVPGARTTYLTLTFDSRTQRLHMPVITLQNDLHDAFEAARVHLKK